jgi:hypothetical protein
VVRACEARLQVERDTAAEWRRLFHVQRDSVAELRRRATDSALAGADSAARAVDLLASERRSLLVALLHPEIRPGGFAGVCTTGSLCAGAGLILTWRF